MDIWPFLVAFLSILLGVLGGRLLQEVLEHILFQPKVKKALELADSTSALVANAVKYLVYFLAFLVAVSQFPVGDLMLNILALIMLLSILLLLLYSLKDFISNSLSGFLIMRQKTISEGDAVEISGVKGKIRKISLIFTEIELDDKSVVIMPNSSIVNRKIIKRQSD